MKPEPEANNPQRESALPSATLLDCAVQLLKVAACPNCDGSGGFPIGAHHVTHEMAMDAGEPSMEGQIAQIEYAQCQWCDERKQLLSNYEAQHNVRVSASGGVPKS